jgi:hypothetical protein
METFDPRFNIALLQQVSMSEPLTKVFLCVSIVCTQLEWLIMTGLDARPPLDGGIPLRTALRVRPELHHIATARDELAIARCSRVESDIEAARDRVQDAVDAARSVDIGWEQIGQTLGIARGNAYQRYRHRRDLASA